MLRVRATDDGGTVLLDATLGHGSDPHHLLWSRGLEPSWRGARWEPDDHAPGGRVLVLEFAVRPAPAPHPHQRIAGYAVVVADLATLGDLAGVSAGARSRRGPAVLLTSLRGTAREGWWTLPGGGLEPGEDPEAGVRREVHEETGQQVVLEAPLALRTAHWTGEAPSGRWEDFHAVRMVWRASCPQPRPLQVHDVGGTTDEAAWVPLADLADRRVLEWVHPLISQVSSDLGWGP